MAIPANALSTAQALLKTDWTSLHLYSKLEDQTSLPSRIAALSSEEATALRALFTSREYALRAGIVLDNEKYAVHQWETTRGVHLVYGRRGDAVSGVGACVGRATYTDGQTIHAVITYCFPSISANAVSKLISFMHDLGMIEEKVAPEDAPSSEDVTIGA